MWQVGRMKGLTMEPTIGPKDCKSSRAIHPIGFVKTEGVNQMHIEVQRRDALSFLLMDSKDFPPSAKRFAAMAEREGGMILVAFLSDRPVGMLALQKLGESMDVNYFYVIEPFRRKGIGYALMRKALLLVEIPVTLRIIWAGGSRAALKHLAVGCGFALVNSAEIFHCSPCHRESRRAWASFYEGQGEKLCLRTMRSGRQILRFEEADGQLLNSLFGIPGGEFTLRYERMDQHYSRLLVTENEALSFAAVTLHENRIIVELAGVRKEWRNTGVFFPPLFHLIQELIDEHFQLVIFTVYDGNGAMCKLTDGFLSGMISTKQRQVFYRWFPAAMQDIFDGR